MSFDWQKYLHLAKELAGKPIQGEESREAKLRSAISRSYYAAFHTAKGYAITQDTTLSLDRHTENSHRSICQWFQKHPHKLARQIGVDLDRIRKSRNQADYDTNMGSLNVINKVALTTIQTAERISTNIASLLKSS
jgi:uncharacterized protein (UPF0332 family)